jgi:hypothetical protein
VRKNAELRSPTADLRERLVARKSAVIALAIDDNFDHHILRALLRRVPDLHSAALTPHPKS